MGFFSVRGSHKRSEVGLIYISTVHVNMGNTESGGLLETGVKLADSLG